MEEFIDSDLENNVYLKQENYMKEKNRICNLSNGKNDTIYFILFYYL